MLYCPIRFRCNKEMHLINSEIANVFLYLSSVIGTKIIILSEKMWYSNGIIPLEFSTSFIVSITQTI